MRILLVAGLDISLPGGVETHVRELARGLTARGHDVEVLGGWSRPEAGSAPALAGDLRPERHDIVHHHGGAWKRRWDAGERYLRTFHFSVAAKMAVYLRMGRVRTLFHPGNHRALADERASLRRGRRHIAVSRSLRDELVRFHGASRDAIEVIPNGASFASPREGRDAWRRRHAIPPEARVLLTIGRDDYVKGLDLLERAWTRARREAGGSARSPAGASPADALWVQVGGTRPERRDDRIVTGPIAASDVTEWIHAADVGAFPSYYEGGGIALADMLAGGLYVLTHAVGVAPETIRPGENGEFVPRRADAWAAALARALADPPRPAAPGLPAAWGWDHVVERVESLYRGRLEGAS